MAAGSGSASAFGKYFSTVARLGGRVSSEPKIMHRAEPKTIGTTVIKPFQKLTSPRGFRETILIASWPWPSCQITSPALCVFCNTAEPIKHAATNSVDASAPHLVLRFQNSAATITGAIAANPENA